jgi:hypothetical protein
MQSTGYSSHIVMKLEFPTQIFEKYTDIKFHENPSSGNRVVTCGRTDRQTEMTKLIVSFRNLANAPKKIHFIPHRKRNASPLQTSTVKVMVKVSLSDS